MNSSRLWLALCLLCFPAPLTAGPIDVLVPAYFYPAGQGQTYWNQLDAAAASIGVNAIMNPASGPGVAPDPNYVAAVNNLRAAGGNVLGYLPTTFGNRPAAAVLADIASYSAWYNVNGIFLDEMSNDASAAHLAYSASIYSAVKAAHPTWTVVGNPGTATDEAYFSYAGGPAADVLVVFENTASAYATYTPSAWNASYPSSKFAHIIHTEPTATGMLGDIDLALARNAGMVFVTDDSLPNPYDTLPSYWEAEVAKLAALPEPSAGLLLASGLMALVGWRGAATRKNRDRS